MRITQKRLYYSTRCGASGAAGMEASSQLHQGASLPYQEATHSFAACSKRAGGLFETGILILRHEAAPLLTDSRTAQISKRQQWPLLLS
eukprot:scaffold1636_cov103-Skeletonema_dohrnii-CCMP3373.AAC.2